jgi:hypothetical protein
MFIVTKPVKTSSLRSERDVPLLTERGTLGVLETINTAHLTERRKSKKLRSYKHRVNIAHLTTQRYGDLESGLLAASNFDLSLNHLAGEARRLAADLSRESLGASTSSGGIGGAL